jgi:hypothetical protein
MMDSKEELSGLVGRHAWSLADYAAESGLLLDLESARERGRIGSKLEAKSSSSVCARARVARGRRLQRQSVQSCCRAQ